MGICEGCISNQKNIKTVLTSEQIIQISEQIKDCICEIINEEGIRGTAFFCQIPFNDDSNIPALITTNKILNQNNVLKGNSIKLYLSDSNKKITINKNRKTYTNEIFDVTIIEIFPEKDGIDNFLYLDYDLTEQFFEAKYLDSEIYILQHQKTGLPSYSSGIIKGISNYDIDHECLVEKGASGGPIVSLTTNKVIGILREGFMNEYNKGTLLQYPIKEFNKIYSKNEISIVVEIKDKIDLNTEIFFLDNSEGKYENGEKHNHDNLTELSDSNTTLFINNVQQKFKKSFKPTEKGKYFIKIIFNLSLKNISYMFSNCSKITKIDFTKFNAKNIINMKYLFYKCVNLEKLDLSNFITKKVEDMQYCFAYCEKLKTIKMDFNTINTTNMAGMFIGCNELIDINISKFNTIKVTNMKSMFEHCTKIKLININHFELKNVTDISSMFRDCNSLVKIQTKFLDISNVKNMEYLFSCCYNLLEFDLSVFKNTNKVENMAKIFYDCNNITSLNFSKFNTENVKNMGAMFYNCKKLKYINLKGVNTENVTNMGAMFYECNKLENLDLSSFNTKNVTNMGSMFYDCYKLTSLDLSSFATNNVVNMISMFELCENLTELKLTHFNTSKVKNMNSMFSYCLNLYEIDLSSFNTKNVVNMSCMFDHCENIENIIMPNFDTKNVMEMKSMFNNCSSLVELNLLSFSIYEDTKIFNMFNGCNNLKKLKVNRASYNHIKDLIQSKVQILYR